MTYFGQALLGNLPTSNNLQEVYRLTVDDVTKREAEEELTSSEPQLYVGEHILNKLNKTLNN